MKYLEKLRRWAIRRLGGLDRGDCERFAAEFLTARAGITLQPDGLLNFDWAGDVVVNGSRARIVDGQFAGRIYVAPWVSRLTIANCVFLPASRQ